MSRPKDFDTWSAAKQEKWREKRRKIARKSYARHADERRRKVRLYKARIRGTVLVEGDFAKKRKRRPEIRMCIGRRCSKTMEYKVWIGRDKVCKSCKAKMLHEEKRHEQMRRRFYKLVAAHGCYGKLCLRDVRVRTDQYFAAFDWHLVETLDDPRGWETVRGYMRGTDEHRRGRPHFECRAGAFYNDTWRNWLDDAYSARRKGEAAYARGAAERYFAKIRNRARQRALAKDREIRLRRETKEAEQRAAAEERKKEKEKARKAKLEAARLAGLRRSKLSSDIPFFQMMAGAGSIARYVEEQTPKTNNHETHDRASEIR